MSAFIGYLSLLAPVVAVVWIVWAFRRKTAAKEARSEERAAALMALRQSGGGSSGMAALERAAVHSGSGPTAATPAPGASRDRFLTQPATLTYYLLKAGLPGYEVFPRVALTTVLADPESGIGQPPGRQQRAVRHEIDFVVCDKNMRLVAAVRLGGHPSGPDGEWAEGRLAAAGIRVVKVNPAALPRREQVGALVLGRAD